MKRSRLLSIAAAVGAAAAGFAVRPPAIRPPSGHQKAVDHVAVPTDLPAAVDRFVRETYGEAIPAPDTVSLWGRIRMRIGPVRFHATMQNHHVVGRAFAARFALTWYGIPVVRGIEGYAAGRGFSQQAWIRPTGPHIDTANALTMWSEACLFPSAIVAQPAARWRELGPDLVELTAPAGEVEVTAQIAFDRESGRPVRFRADRFRDATTAIGWDVVYRDWRWVGPLLLPGSVSVRWDDEAEPWLVGVIEGAVTGLDAPFGPVPPAWVDVR